jgi:hypothetical protein
MFQYTHYYGRFQDLRGGLGELPRWARFIVAVAAVPGLILLALSILAFVVSVLALLLLTVPVYSLLKRLTVAAGYSQGQSQATGVRRVEATIVEVE